MVKIFITKNRAGTQKLASDFAQKILKSEPQRKSVIIGLIGDLGSGKTIFAKGFARRFGIKNQITSPTFVLEKIYKLNAKNYKHLVHIDAYRVENPKEISALGFKELIHDNKNIILIEWADKIKNILPKNCIKIFFEHAGKNNRKIKINLKNE